MTGHRAREGHRLRVREVIGSQRDIFGTFDVEWQCGRRCHSGLSVQFRVEGTATRAWAHSFGTFDVEWQCEGVLPVRSTSSGSVGGAATRA
ncbi:hypothetical protein ADJ70_06155 [Olsenella sp. oral taxon 807]|nr:hypothetical protein ADJ70_06155 [Olsenella sp. oral taxon 807]